MRTSDTIGKIAAALAAAQANMGAALKDSQNPHFRSRYADLASVVEATRPHLAAQGIAIVQLPETSRETGEVAVTTALVHSSGEVIACRLSAVCKDLAPQPVGSAITYLRRYGLLSVAGIAPDDDDGEAAMGRPQERHPEPRPEPRKEDAPPPNLAKAVEIRCGQIGATMAPVRYREIAAKMLDMAKGDAHGALHAIESGRHDNGLRTRAAEYAVASETK